MIAAIRGRVVHVDEEIAVVDVNGVGYAVHCHLRTIAALREQGERDVLLQVHTAVSADDIRLFGFLTRKELGLFRLLIGVERIGPKAATTILGRAELPTLIRAIRGGDAAFVATVPGVGRKTAERVILELRDKLDDLALPSDAVSAPAPATRAVDSAIAGLVGLGFREAEARAAVTSALTEAGENADMGGLLSAALRRLDSVPA